MTDNFPPIEADRPIEAMEAGRRGKSDRLGSISTQIITS